MGIQGSNIDFPSPVEALNGIQRNPQLDNKWVASGTVTLSTSAIYAVVAPTGTVLVSDTGGTQYTVAAPGLVFPFGAPISWSPQVGPVTFTSANSYTVIYHL